MSEGRNNPKKVYKKGAVYSQAEKEELWDKCFHNNACWTDGSGFEFDGEPNNLVGYRPSMSSYFSMEGKMAKNLPKQWNLWSNWVDKFQTDYRFLLLSDTNAETILQPNVDDPWMFTEYVFKGTGVQYITNYKETKDEAGQIKTEKEGVTTESITELVIEPPLYDEKTLLLINPDRIFDDGVKTSTPPYEYEVECSKYNRERIIKEDGTELVKACRQVSPDGWGNGFEVKDQSVKLYKVTLNVESVKWGEHGNIPPHTLNMYAPPPWIDVKKKKTITPVTVAKVGYPIYAKDENGNSVTGMFYHKDDNDYIVPMNGDNFSKDGDDNYAVYNYIVNENTKKNGILIPKGESLNSAYANKLTVKHIRQCNDGDIVHEGCEFLKGNNGRCYCERADRNDPDYTSTLKLNIYDCMYKKMNTSCPGWVQKSTPIVSTYETVSKSKDQYLQSMYGTGADDALSGAADLVLNATPISAVVGVGMMAYASAVTRFQPGLTDYTEPTVWFETTFKVVEEPEQSFVIDPEKPKDFGKGTKVVRGSGYQVIDEIIPWQGGDNYAVGDMNQVNYTKFMQSVMPCYNPDYCNEICGVAMQSGYSASSRAGSKTQNSPDAEGVFIDYCRYYHSKDKDGVECPYGGVPKTAFEFQEAQILAKDALESVILGWIDHYSDMDEAGFFNLNADFFIVRTEQQDASEETGGSDIPLHYTMYSKKDESTRFGGIYCGGKENVSLRHFDDSGQEATTELELCKICKFTLSSFYPSMSRIVDIYFWWNAINNNGAKIATWFCKLDKELSRSTNFTYYVDNWNKFIGGYHPEYKDYSKHGSEFIQKKEEVIEDREGLGDLGGDPEYKGIENPVSEEGYWTDADGEWILDERDLKENLWLDENDKPLPTKGVVLEREKRDGEKEEKVFYLTEKEEKVLKNKDSRTSWGGISYSQTNTTGSGAEKKSPRCRNCAVYDNDTNELIEALRFSPPQVEEDDKKVNCPPSVGYVDDEYNALPSQRTGAYCPVCKYYAYIKYVGCACPHCGSELEERFLRKYYKLKSIGKVDYWGLPGTVIDAKSYFWKNPTLINQALLDQICFKAKNNGSGANSSSELNGGYINDTKGYYKPVPTSDTEQTKENYGNVWGKVKKEEGQEDIASFNPFVKEQNTTNNGFDVSKTDDQLIVPYSDDKGLKFFTLSHLTALRKTVEPAMGYLIGEYPNNPDYERNRPTYENRTSITAPKNWVKGRCGIKPQILAATNRPGGGDVFITYYSGDPEVGSVREYYPPGTTWWLINNKIGCRYTDNGKSLIGLGIDPKSAKTHLDSEEYGTETQSMMCVFLHGFLPLNKKILAAYAVIRPASDPARQPFGKSWNGYRYYYEHYHAFTKRGMNQAGVEHEAIGEHLHLRAGEKYFVYDEYGDAMPYSSLEGNNEYNAGNYIRVTPYNAAQHEWKPGAFTGNKKRKSFDRMNWDSNGMPHYVPVRPPKYSDLYCIEEPDCKFLDDGKYYPEFTDYKVGLEEEYHSMYEYTTETYAEFTEKIHGFFDENWYGKLVTNTMEDDLKFESSLSGTEPLWDYIKLEGQYENDPNWTRYGKDIIQLKTKNQIWKDTTSEEFQEMLDYNTGDFYFSATDGEDEVGYDFKSMNNSLITDYLSEQLQEIPGYFNYSNMNTSGSQNGNIKIIEPKPDKKLTHEQILFQDDSQQNQDNSTNKSDDYFSESGNVERVLDITPIVQAAYNKRIKREFGVKTGVTPLECLENLKSVEESAWEGIGSEPTPAERVSWNKRFYNSYGMWLSDYYSYPEIDKSTGNIKTPSQYEKYMKYFVAESNSYTLISDEQIKGKTFPPYIEVVLTYSDYKSEIKSVDTKGEVIESGNDFYSKLKNILSSASINCEVSLLAGSNSSKRLMIRVNDCQFFTIEGLNDFFTDADGIYGFGRTDRITSCSGYLPGYHPMNLCDGYNFNPEETEIPWLQTTYLDQNEFFVVDLVSVPFEKSRRDWRHRMGTKDCSNCYCPNENCNTKHPRKEKVGVWAKANKTTMSKGQTTCPSCGADLSNEKGVVSIDSDGINSYFYDSKFADEPILSAIEIKGVEFSNDDTLSPYKCNYKVFIENRGVWNEVLDARLDEKGEKMVYTTPEYEDDLIEYKKGVVTFNTNPKYPVFRSRYVRVETEPTEKRIRNYEKVVSYNENIIILDRNDISNGALVGQVVRFNNSEWFEENETTEDYKILSNYIQEGQMVVVLNKMVSIKTEEGESAFCSFYAKKYYSGILSFKVFGVPYRDNEITMTPKGDIELFPFDTSGVKLSNQPIQIQNVWVNGVRFTEVDDEKDIKIWAKKSKSYKTSNAGANIFYYTIESGTFYYSIQTNKIYVANVFEAGNNIQIPISQISNYFDSNNNVVGNRSNGGIGSISVEYWSGRTGGVTLKAHASGTGPSYQLDEECICKISNPDDLPPCGKSVKLPDTYVNSDNKLEAGRIARRDIEWFCYNHIPSTLPENQQTSSGGYFRKPVFYGNELGQLSENTPKEFINLFGENCTGFSQRCETEITFYGKPNMVLSGGLGAYAPETNKIENNNGSVIIEKTGGLANGCFVLKLSKGKADNKGRKTKAWGDPLIVVYAQDDGYDGYTDSLW